MNAPDAHAAPITARTQVAAVIGNPIRHSLSPTLHNAAFAATGLDWRFVAFDVAPGGAGRALDAMRTLGIRGYSVTMPHKTDVAAACDTLSADAAQLRSVNCVVPREGGTLHGESTDGEGFVRSLADAGVDLHGRSVLLLGAGGAARAVALSLARAGARLSVSARRPEAAAQVAALAPGTGIVGWSERTEAAAAAELIVNGTPVGMGDDTGMPLPEGVVRAGQVVADLVVHPLTTPLLAAAERAGAQPVGGLGMLVHQAAIAFTHFTGIEAPVAAMRCVVEAQ